MYPYTFMNIFYDGPRRNSVFVAMSFDKRFAPRWESVIQPAINSIIVEGTRLTAERVDVGQISDSILTRILDGVRAARVVFADITTVGTLGDRPIRNPNVMYEVGLAHAWRPPTEVVLFRSDDDALIFDIANIRVNRYDPDSQPAEARSVIAMAIRGAIDEAQLTAELAVERAAHALDSDSWELLLQAAEGRLRPPAKRTIGEQLRAVPTLLAIRSLLDRQMICLSYPKVNKNNIRALDEIKPEDAIQYLATPLGRAVITLVARESGIASLPVELLNEIGELPGNLAPPDPPPI